MGKKRGSESNSKKKGEEDDEKERPPDPKAEASWKHLASKVDVKKDVKTLMTDEDKNIDKFVNVDFMKEALATFNLQHTVKPVDMTNWDMNQSFAGLNVNELQHIKESNNAHKTAEKFDKFFDRSEKFLNSRRDSFNRKGELVEQGRVPSNRHSETLDELDEHDFDPQSIAEEDDDDRDEDHDNDNGNNNDDMDEDNNEKDDDMDDNNEKDETKESPHNAKNDEGEKTINLPEDCKNMSKDELQKLFFDWQSFSKKGHSKKPASSKKSPPPTSSSLSAPSSPSKKARKSAPETLVNEPSYFSWKHWKKDSGKKASSKYIRRNKSFNGVLSLGSTNGMSQELSRSKSPISKSASSRRTRTTSEAASSNKDATASAATTSSSSSSSSRGKSKDSKSSRKTSNTSSSSNNNNNKNQHKSSKSKSSRKLPAQ